MKDIIYLYKKSIDTKILEILSQNYSIHHAKTLREAILQLIDKPSVCGVIMDYQFSHKVIFSIIEKLTYLNPTLPLIMPLLGRDKTKYEQYNQLYLTDSLKATQKILESNQLDRRHFVRMNWPIQAHFFQEEHPEVYEKGLTLSLSANGVYISAKASPLLLKKNLYLHLCFEDFSILTEIEILRINLQKRDSVSQGFAAIFLDITQHTQEFLDSILKDKIVRELLEETDQYGGHSKNEHPY